jgi:hypothetical protein
MGFLFLFQSGAQLQATSAICDTVFKSKISSVPAESHIALGSGDKS